MTLKDVGHIVPQKHNAAIPVQNVFLHQVTRILRYARVHKLMIITQWEKVPLSIQSYRKLKRYNSRNHYFNMKIE